MTARKPIGYPCHVDEDLAHVVTAPDEELRPCTRRHRAAPSSMTSEQQAARGLAPRTRVRILTEPADVLAASKLGSTLRPGERITIGKGKPAPSSAPAASRSAPKRARPTPVGSGRPYTDEQRTEALRLIREHGIAHAHRVTGVPKGTLSRWAKAAGIDLDAAVKARTRAAADAVEARAAELKLTTVDRLEAILEQQLTTIGTLGELERRATLRVLESDVRYETSIGGPVPVPVDDEARDALARIDLITRAIPKRDLVGAWTRAVHDLALLKGEATERGTILVRFGIPRPNAAEADASAVDEVDLGKDRS